MPSRVMPALLTSTSTGPSAASTCFTPAAADAERREPLLGVAALHLVEERDQNPRPRRADRVADGDGAAIDVDDIGVPAHFLVDRAGLRRESLVGLDQVEVVDLPAGLL